MAEDQRTPAERIAYAQALISQLEDDLREPWQQESLEACLEALSKLVDKILSGV